jgi:hypothetical protein
LYDLQLTNGPPTQKEKHDFWVEIYKDAALVPEDTFSDRIKVCYRLTRALAYWKGIVTDDQTLEEGCHIEPSPWNTPVTCVSNFAPDGHRHGMVQAQTTPLPLSPPEAEDGLQQWLKIMGRIAGRLGVAVSESGRRAMKWLLEPSMVHEMWIDKNILMAYEKILLNELLNAQVDLGVYEGQTEVRAKFALTAKEARVLGDLARLAAPDISNDNLETKKALMELRVDKFMRRAREEGDLRAELQGLKLLALVQGLNKAEPEDDLKGMVNVVAEVSNAKEEELDEDDP